jgi:hypothetical protein
MLNQALPVLGASCCAPLAQEPIGADVERRFDVSFHVPAGDAVMA